MENTPPSSCPKRSVRSTAPVSVVISSMDLQPTQASLACSCLSGGSSSSSSMTKRMTLNGFTLTLQRTIMRDKFNSVQLTLISKKSRAFFHRRVHDHLHQFQQLIFQDGHQNWIRSSAPSQEQRVAAWKWLQPLNNKMKSIFQGHDINNQTSSFHFVITIRVSATRAKLPFSSECIALRTVQAFS